MNNTLEEIKRRIDVVDFIGTYVQLKKAGRNFKANCPFHQEKSASFVISPDRQIWHCFGACGDGGDIVKFLMKWENITFYEALKELAQKANIQLENNSYEDNEWRERTHLLKLNSVAAEYYHYILVNTQYGKKAMDYLKNRDINPGIIKTFQLGYAPQSWDSLMQFLKKKGFSEKDIFTAGLIVRNEKGNCYDRFRGRLMFPIKDVRGNVIGFSGRIIEGVDKSAKYVNTPETPIYHKRESLYGIQFAKEAIKKANSVLLVEGEFDMITPYQHGIENIVAIKGAAVTKEQLMILKRFTNRVVLALDTDVAGQEAIKRAIEEAEKQEFEINIVQFDKGKDPDEAVRTDPITFKKNLQTLIPIYDFIMEKVQKQYPPQDPFNKKIIGEQVIPFIADIQNPIVQSHYIRKLAAVLEVNEESISKLLVQHRRKFTSHHRFLPKNRIQQTKDRETMLQKYLLSRLFQSPEIYAIAENVRSYLESNDFTIPAYGKLLFAIATYQKDHADGFDVASFADFLPAELQAVFDEVYLFSSTELETNKTDIIKIALDLKRHILRKRIGKLLEADDASNPQLELTSLTQSLNEVEKSLKSL